MASRLLVQHIQITTWCFFRRRMPELEPKPKVGKQTGTNRCKGSGSHPEERAGGVRIARAGEEGNASGWIPHICLFVASVHADWSIRAV
jgi:hypothetical protein